jgi:hypothetical protein
VTTVERWNPHRMTCPLAARAVLHPGCHLIYAAASRTASSGARVQIRVVVNSQVLLRNLGIFDVGRARELARTTSSERPHRRLVVTVYTR